MSAEVIERRLRLALITVAVGALAAGLVAWYFGAARMAHVLWIAGTAPVVAALAAQIVRDLMAGRLGVDAVALVSMSVALILGESLAGIVVAVMYAGGNVLEDFAIGRAERELRALVDRAPRISHRIVGETVDEIPVEQVVVGDEILVRGGEIVPVDGVILSVSATLDESALTGEPLPAERRMGEAARSGVVNAGETFRMRATAIAGESTYAGIVRMVTAAQTTKSPFIRLADRFALFLLPVSLAIAAAAWAWSGDPIRALAVLVAATPCPLILAAPVAFIAGVSQAASNGVLVKGGGPLEALARARTVMFDKTGTLTVGGARLISIETAPGVDRDEVLRLAGSLEQASPHVVAAAIVQAALARGLVLSVPTEVREEQGAGLRGVVDGHAVVAGSFRHVFAARQPEDWAVRVVRRASWRSALSVFVSIDGRGVGAILLGDELRRETPRVVQKLRHAGVERIVMVTGDRADGAEAIAAALDLDTVLADRTPSDKVDAVVIERRARPTAMVGDGINDAPALAAADVGIAMGARGASASSQAADVVILVDRLDRMADAFVIARRARAIALQSIGVGLGLSGIAMGFAATGMLTPVAGALIQEGIDVAVILNALRALVPGRHLGRSAMPSTAASVLRQEHMTLEPRLQNLREIADLLDDATPSDASALIASANVIVQELVEHERSDEREVYPRLAPYLSDNHGLGAMSRAHREILHLARLLERLRNDLDPREADRYVIRDAQRLIEAIESLVHVHNAQEEDIYEHAVSH